MTEIMKNKEIISTVLSAFSGLIVLALTLFNKEMKIWLSEHWMVVMFFFGLFLVSLSLIAFWVRFILKGIIKDYYIPLNNEITILRNKYDKLIGPDPETALLTGLKSSVVKSLLIRLIRFFI
jgi:hypothetical protein